jgi:hypothetical protein
MVMLKAPCAQVIDAKTPQAVVTVEADDVRKDPRYVEPTHSAILPLMFTYRLCLGNGSMIKDERIKQPMHDEILDDELAELLSA